MRVFYIAMEHMSKTNGGKGGHFIATSSIMGKRVNVLFYEDNFY